MLSQRDEASDADTWGGQEINTAMAVARFGGVMDTKNDGVRSADVCQSQSVSQGQAYQTNESEDHIITLLGLVARAEAWHRTEAVARKELRCRRKGK
jgi:hypothetical protein